MINRVGNVGITPSSIKNKQKVSVTKFAEQKDSVSFGSKEKTTRSVEDSKRIIKDAKVKAAIGGTFASIISPIVPSLRSDEKVAKKAHINQDEKELIHAVRKEQVKSAIGGAMFGIFAIAYQAVSDPIGIDYNPSK